MHPRAVIFDCEGVIIDTEGVAGNPGPWDLAATTFLNRYGHPYDRALIQPLLTGRSLAEGTRVLKHHFQLPGSLTALAAQRKALVATAFATSVGYISGFEAFYSLVQPHFQTAIATALDPALFALVDQNLGLTQRFNGHVITLASAPWLRPKPHPDLFLYAATHLRLPASSCVVIEDSPFGLAAAKAAGMYAIGLATTYPEPLLAGADRVIEDFAHFELAALQNL